MRLLARRADPGGPAGAGRRRRTRPVPPVAVLVAVALVAASCGARVPPYFPAAVASGAQGPTGAAQASGPSGGSSQLAGPATGASAAAGSGQAASGGGSQGGQVASKGPSTASGGGQSQVPSGGVAALTPANFSYDPQTQASYCTGTAGNTASAPGVTASTITVGNVSGLTGAVSDSFTAGAQAVTAVFDAINRFGGICGRQLKVQVEDDQQSSSNNAADVQYLIPHVLAFVGSLSDADNGGVNAMVAAGTPDLGPAININRSNSPVYWSADGGSVTVKGGQAYVGDAWINGMKQYGAAPSNICVLAYNIPISAQAGQEYTTLFEKEGIPSPYQDYNVPPAGAGTVMSSVVSTMQQKGCTGVFTTMDVVGNDAMMQAMQAQQYQPKLVGTTYEGYTPDQISTSQGAAAYTHLDVFLSSVPLSDPVPGVQEYQQEMSTYEPGQPPSEFGLEAWDDAELFVYALLKSGRNPTRQSLTSALEQVTNWTSDGAFGPYTPSNRTGPPCVTNVVVQGNNFVETWPPSGLYCNNTYVDVGPASG